MSLSTAQLKQLRESMTAHPIYRELKTADSVRTFMRHEVFAVWAAMSLLKRLQRDLTWVTVPWMPRPHQEYVRYIGELVLAEESDVDDRGGYVSHFDLFLSAMEEAGADTLQIKTFLNYMEASGDIYQAMELSGVPKFVAQFVDHTIKLASTAETYQVCAVYFGGRPETTPTLFEELLDEMGGAEGEITRLLYYLHRQIELDTMRSRAVAGQLLSHLLDGDPERESRAYRTIQEAIRVRTDLYDGILKELDLQSAMNR